MSRFFQWRTLWEGRWIFTILAVFFLLALVLSPWISIAGAVLCGLALVFSLHFFRDPKRVIPSDPDLLVAPADGLVTHTEDVPTLPHLNLPGRRVSIFLSVFDVHVNRSPVAGTVRHIEDLPGAFLDARHPESHTRNASCTWMIEEAHTGRRILVRQITGAIARRIVPWSKVGDLLERGERFGMIRFGSRTDLFIPREAEILVRPGQKVRGGETAIARWQTSSESTPSTESRP